MRKRDYLMITATTLVVAAIIVAAVAIIVGLKDNSTNVSVAGPTNSATQTTPSTDTAKTTPPEVTPKPTSPEATTATPETSNGTTSSPQPTTTVPSADEATAIVPTPNANAGCSANTHRVELLTDGKASDIQGPIQVKKWAAYVEIKWGDSVADTVIADGSKQGYVRKNGADMPQESRLYLGTGDKKWNQITNLTACVQQ